MSQHVNPLAFIAYRPNMKNLWMENSLLAREDSVFFSFSIQLIEVLKPFSFIFKDLGFNTQFIISSLRNGKYLKRI